MSDTDDLEARVTNLEDQVARLQGRATLAISDAAAARLLAAGADQDVSAVRAELRAHTQALNALRETQMGQGQMINRLEQKVTGLEQKMTDGFVTLGTGMAQITALLTGKLDSDQD